MAGETIIDVASRYEGKQETFGANDGPNIRIWKQELGPGVAQASGIPWCAIFVANVFMMRNRLSRKQLCSKLGFRPSVTYFESCDSWAAELRFLDALRRARGEAPIIVDRPEAGDVVLLMEKRADGTYSINRAHHILIATSSLQGGTYSSVEGNTVSGTDEGKLSRNGDGVYRRRRVYAPGRQMIARFPSSLTGLGG